jgi:UDP-GlcNAc:undecaprenyl-phosphate GlcNAc-1-phosphate transferase
LLRELLNNKNVNIQPIGFIDDDMRKIGKRLQGFSILGAFQDLETLVEKYGIDSLVISFNNRDPNQMQLLKKFCKENDLRLKQFLINVEDVDLEA